MNQQTHLHIHILFFLQKGSFIAKQNKYFIETYHPNVHKRSVGARKGDLIVRKQDDNILKGEVDYICMLSLYIIL